MAVGTIAVGLALTLAACSTPVEEPATPKPETSQEADTTIERTYEEDLAATKSAGSSYSWFLADMYDTNTTEIQRFYDKHSEDTGTQTEAEKLALVEEMESVLPGLGQIDKTSIETDEVLKLYNTIFEFALTS